MDYQDILLRYLGRQVSITTFGYVKIYGQVAAVNEDHVRLTNTLVTSEHDDQGWYSQMQHADPDAQVGPRNTETLVQFHQIVAITCQDENLDESPPAASQPAASSSAPARASSTLAAAEAFLSGGDAPVEPTDDSWDKNLLLDRLRLEIGSGLLKLATPDSGELLRRIQLMRSQVAGELGIVIPKIRVMDNVHLRAHQYRILLEDATIATSELMADRLLAIDSGQVTKAVAGTATKEPVYGLPALWIGLGQREPAEMHGYLVCDASSALAVHLQHVVKQHAAELFSLDDLRQLLARLEKTCPAAVAEAQLRVPVPEIHAVLRRLLEEDVSIKNLPRILEAISLRACTAHETEDLVVAARVAIRRALCQSLCSEDGHLTAVTLDEGAAECLSMLVTESNSSATPWVGHLVACLSRFFRDTPQRRSNLALVVERDLRQPLWKLLHSHLARQVVLSRDEVPAEVTLDVLREISLDDLGLPAGSLVDLAETGEDIQEHGVKSRPLSGDGLPADSILPRLPR